MTTRDKRQRVPRRHCAICFGELAKKGGPHPKHPLVCRPCGDGPGETGEDLQGSGWSEDWGIVHDNS